MAFELVRHFFGRGSPLRSRTPEPAMENGTFDDQEGNTPHGKRDVEKTAEFSNWSELARASKGGKLEDKGRLGYLTYIYTA